MTGEVTPTPMPAPAATARELMGLARRIERYGAQRRKLLKRVEELDAQIREAKRMLRALTELLAGRELPGMERRECTCGAGLAAPRSAHTDDCTALVASAI